MEFIKTRILYLIVHHHHHHHHYYLLIIIVIIIRFIICISTTDRVEIEIQKYSNDAQKEKHAVMFTEKYTIKKRIYIMIINNDDGDEQ